MAGRDDLDPVQQFIDDLDLGGFEHVFDDDLELWMAFGVNNQPAFVFIDGAGNADVIIRSLGEAGISAGLDSILER